VAHFTEINDKNASASLFMSMTLYVGANRYQADYTDLNNVFPNAVVQRSQGFTIAPGSPPTKLKLAPEYPNWTWLPFYNPQFLYDLRGVSTS
jgi:hypothetical protein